MADFNINQEIAILFSTEAFRQLFTSDVIRIAQLNAAIALLIKLGIPFDVEFSPGTRRVATAAQLTIYINPTTTLNFTLTFEAGGSIFGGGGEQ